MQALISVITSEIPDRLTKCYRLEGEKLIKETVGNMAAGSCEVVAVRDIYDLSDVLKSLKHNQALCFGVPKDCKPGDKVKIVPESQKKPGEYSRTEKDFEWPTSGVMFLDHDDELSQSEFEAVIINALPELQTVDKIWFPSSSSFIYNGKKAITGLKGQRLYFLVDNAKKIPEIGKTIYRRLWLAGLGSIKISAAGSLLERSPVDASVWQKNRLDFAAGAYCEKPLEQKRGAPINMPGYRKFLEVDRVQKITGKEDFQYMQLVNAAKSELRPEAEKTQKQHIEKRLEGVPEADKAKLREFYKSAYNGGSLAGDFEITLFKDGKKMLVPVSEILRKREFYHECKTLDPIEPEYNNYHKTGKLFLSANSAILDSKAHGGKIYRLTETIQKNEVDQVFDEMANDVEDQLAGKVFTIPLPWTRLSHGTNALREGTVTVICGATKVGKSLFSMNIVKHLHENSISWGYLPLEDSKKEWTWRILAILEKDFAMMSDKIESAGQRAKAMSRRASEIKSYIENVAQNPRLESVMINGRKTRKSASSALILNWAETQAKQGKRVIFIDPLAQISFNGFKKWEAEESFVQDLCGIAADYKISIVLVSHTKKGNSDDSLSVEDMQGSAAFGRLCQTSILIGSFGETVEVDIARRGGDVDKEMANRMVVVGAARNGSGTRSRLAYIFGEDGPTFKEIGFLSAQKKGKK